MEGEKKYRYNEETERYKKMNQVYIIAAIFLWVLFLIYLLIKLQTSEISRTTVYGNIILVVVFLIGNLFIYFRKKESVRLKQVIAIEVGLEFLLLGVQTDAEFIYYGPLGILALQIPYYDKKAYQCFCIAYPILFTIVFLIQNAKYSITEDTGEICCIICVYLMFYVLYKVGSTAWRFSADALASVAEQSGRQKEMLEHILDTSQTVSEESQKSTGLVDSLVGATQKVAQSMQEISAASATTAESIEEQNTMTQTIQEAIVETGDHSKKMVTIATDSNHGIQENLQVMEELKEQARQIAQTNCEVTEAMDRLQDKTKEVANIAGMILSISSQTNLLALNASIESARAGEAGRGFAVVAGQIRQLSEQTKKSTEAITGIVNELNENANEVVKAVEISVDAANSQSEKILSAAETFEKLNVNMADLVRIIQEIDTQISGLSDSNNRIVENISHLSAATEEVTASAEQVHQMSEQNLDYAKQVKSAIGTIQEKTDNMKQYL